MGMGPSVLVIKPMTRYGLHCPENGTNDYGMGPNVMGMDPSILGMGPMSWLR